MLFSCNGTKSEKKNNQMAEIHKTVCCSEGVTPQNFGFTMDIARIHGKSCVNGCRKVSPDWKTIELPFSVGPKYFIGV